MNKLPHSPSLLVAVFCLLIGLPLHSQNSSIIDHIEPPFWWVDMTEPSLQLLVHGENIADLTASFSYAGVSLEQTILVENPNYLFLNLHIASETRPGSFTIQFQRNGKTVYSYDYSLRQRRPGSAERQGFSTKDIMYLLTPDRFANGDPSNDTVPGMREKANRDNKNGRHGGDIQGIINQLDYLQDMGFTAIWTNPLLENDMEAYSYHGYATTDYYKVDGRFGSNADYLRLSAEAKKRGILLVMDMIANHCGYFHWWTNDLPTSDWYNFQTMEKKPYSSHRRTTITDPYAADIDADQHSDGWFDKIMPDLNQRSPLLATYLIQNSIWWVEYADLGGIRQDTYPYPDPDFMAEWTRRMMEEYPNFNIVGEEWTENPALVARWQAGRKTTNGNVSYLPSLMDFPLQGALISSLNSQAKGRSGAFNPVYNMLANDFLYNDPSNLVVFLDNHDMPRIYDLLNHNADLFKMGLIYLYTVRGIPQVYYGTEILMGKNDIPKEHALIRSDMPGGWQGDKSSVFTGKGLSEDQLAIKSFVRKLTRFRRDTPVLHSGDLLHYVPQNNVYVMFRYNDDSLVMSVFNKNARSTKINLERFEQILAGASTATDAVSGKSIDLTKGTLEIAGTSALMLIGDR